MNPVAAYAYSNDDYSKERIDIQCPALKADRRHAAATNGN